MAEVDWSDQEWGFFRDILRSFDSNAPKGPKNDISTKPGGKLVPKRAAIHTIALWQMCAYLRLLLNGRFIDEKSARDHVFKFERITYTILMALFLQHGAGGQGDSGAINHFAKQIVDQAQLLVLDASLGTDSDKLAMRLESVNGAVMQMENFIEHLRRVGIR